MANDCREQASAVGDRMETRLLFSLRFCILSFAAILIISSSSTFVRGEHFWSSEQSDPLTTYFEQSQQFQAAAANSTSTSLSLRAMREQQAQHLLKDPRFSSINKRRKLESCIDFNPYLSISISTAASSTSASSSAASLLLQDVENVTVTVSGILDPSEADWIAVFSPATAPESVSLSLLPPPHTQFSFASSGSSGWGCSRRLCRFWFSQVHVYVLCVLQQHKLLSFERGIVSGDRRCIPTTSHVPLPCQGATAASMD